MKIITVNKQNKVLILKRSEKTGKGWSLPGGGLEHGEDAHDAAMREIGEETQLEISNIKVFSVNTHKKGKDNSAIIIGFVSKHNKGRVNLNWEHDDYKWLQPEEALKYDLTPDGEYFVKKYLDKIKKGDL